MAQILKSDKKLQVTLTGNTDGNYQPGELIDFDNNRDVPYANLLKARAEAISTKLQQLGVSQRQISTESGTEKTRSTGVKIKNTS